MDQAGCAVLGQGQAVGLEASGAMEEMGVQGMVDRGVGPQGGSHAGARVPLGCRGKHGEGAGKEVGKEVRLELEMEVRKEMGRR